MTLLYSDAEFTAALEATLFPYRMNDHDALQTYIRDGMPLAVAQKIATVYGPINASSPQIMAAGLSRIQDRQLFNTLLRNLWEECGDGLAENSHIAMFERFWRATDAPISYAVKRDSAGEALIDGFLQASRSQDEHCVMAMFHGFEAVFPYICGSIDIALRAGRTLDDANDGHFFSFHATHDLAHARTTLEAMSTFADTSAKRRDCSTWARRGARLIYNVFDSIFTTE